MKPFYITTTLPYVNADPHVGFAVELVRADIVARSKKLAGYEVFFNTGTDEHGQKVAEAAVKLGISPQEYVDKKSEKYRELLLKLGILPETNFIRTTDAHHIKAAQEFWRIVNKNGFIFKKHYQAKYCVGCELEKTDSELDNNGRCLLHPFLEIEIIDEENYFFKASAFRERLADMYEKRPDFVIPSKRFNEIKSLMSREFIDFSISRLKSKMSWGIPVPDDDNQVMYVWFDALVNYVSCIGWQGEVESAKCKVQSGEETEMEIEKKKESKIVRGHGAGNFLGSSEARAEKLSRPQDVRADFAISEDSFQKFWIDSGGVVQYCGKDNLRQQSAMWQAMLLAAGLPPSKTIVIDGFVTGDGGIKMSKSLGNTVDPFELVREYGTDAVRYYAARELHPFEDSPFTPQKFKDAYNAGLANGLGNLVSRVMKMAQDNLPKPVDTTDKDLPGGYTSAFDSFDLQKASHIVWHYVSELDQKIQIEKPFSLVKENLEKGRQVITELVQGIYFIAKMLEPILPETSQKIQTLIKKNNMPEQPLFMRK